MKKLFLPVFLLFSALSLVAQKNHFIYIQSENGQPFYVKLGERTFSSTASGYLILSKLQDSTYTLKLGFPQDRSPEQQYSVSILRRDHGYLLKHFADKGWGLFDLQSLAVQMSANAVARTNTSGKSSVRTVSRFAEILSRASDDPSLKEAVVRVRVPEKTKEPVTEAVAKKEPAKPETEPPKEIVQAAKKEDTNKSIEEPKNESAKVPEVKKEESKSLPVNTDVAKKAETITIFTEPKKEPAKETQSIKEPVTANTEKNTDLAKTEVKKEAAAKVPEEKKQDSVTEAIVKKDETKAVTNKADPAGQATVKKEEPAVDRQKEIALDKPVTKEEAAKENKQPVSETPAESKAVYQPSVVTKKSERSTTQGLGIVFIDARPDGGRDTIDIEIPNPVTVLAAKKEEPKPDKKFLEIGSDATVVKEEEKAPVAETVSAIKNDCRSTAGKTDFFRLRRDMAGSKSDEGMLNLAKRQFKQKCFTVDQLKSLGALFLTDEARYQFFDIAYKHTSDPEHYALLQEELKEAYYINRFKAMLRN